MPFIRIAPGLLECAIHGLWTNGRQVTNMLHVHKEPEVAWNLDPGTDLQVIEDVLFGWQEDVMPGLLNNYQIVDMSFIDLGSLDGISGVLAPNPALPLVGGNAAAAPAPNTSLLIHKNTVSARNQRSGRMYVMALSEADMDENGLVSAPLQAGIDARFATWRERIDQSITAIVYEVHVLHIQIPPGPPPVPPTIVDGSSTEVLSFTTDPVAATQRRRLRA